LRLKLILLKMPILKRHFRLPVLRRQLPDRVVKVEGARMPVTQLLPDLVENILIVYLIPKCPAHYIHFLY
jgi:hypothetical protein